jgi:hypothetical protein
MVEDAIARASPSSGCPAQKFLISATHTHSSNVGGLGQGLPTAKTVVDAVVEGVNVRRQSARREVHVPGDAG